VLQIDLCALYLYFCVVHDLRVWVPVFSVIRVSFILLYDSLHNGALLVQCGVVFVYFYVFVVVVARPTVYTFEIHWLGFAVLQVVIACA
jgi:hypothetical protein